MVAFLRRNGARYSPDQALATTMMIALAAGEVSEESLARWLRDNWPKA
jgi:death-on-curing protein